MAAVAASEPDVVPPPLQAGVDIAPLRRLLADLRRSTRRWIWVESLALVCMAGAVVFWGSLAIDWLLEPPPLWRMAVAAVAVLGLAALVLTKLVGRLATPLPDAALAMLVERGHPAFRDSLSTAIELTDRPRADVDSGLVSRTAAEAAALVDQVDRAKFFRRRRLMGLLLEVRGGDARLRNLRLVVVDAPALARLEIGYTLPDYLGAGRRQAAASRLVQVPAGSMVEIACTATKPLSAATVSAITDGAEEVVGTLAGAAADRTVMASVGPVAGDRTLVVRFTDADGLGNREPISFVLSAVSDTLPQVAVRMPGISTAVTPRAVLPLVGSIADDHGLASARVLLRVADGAEVDLPIGRVQEGAAIVEFPADAPERAALEPLGLAAGRRLTVSVAATDGCRLAGGPNVGVSDTWSLDVVTPEALLAMLEAREIILRRRFESSVADLVQSRDRLAAPDSASTQADDAGDDVARLAEAATRAAGETAEIAAAFRLIRDELANNALLSPELENRLVSQISEPLGRIAAADLPAVSAACRRRAPREEVLRAVDAVLARMRAVLDRMMELESFNEVVDLLRGLIRTQEEIRAETLRRQKQRAREALEQP